MGNLSNTSLKGLAGTDVYSTYEPVLSLQRSFE